MARQLQVNKVIFHNIYFFYHLYYQITGSYYYSWLILLDIEKQSEPQTLPKNFRKSDC